MQSFLFLILSVALICLVWGFIEPHLLCVTRVELNYPNLPNGFEGLCIVQLSDLHACKFGEKNCRLSELVKKEKPDCIFATGDFIDRDSCVYRGFLDLLDSLEGICPVYFSFGNHEGWIGMRRPDELNAFLCELKRRGVYILNDCAADLTANGASARVYGLTPERDIKYNTIEMTGEKMLSKIGAADKDEFNILLAHEPQFFEAYEKWGASLVFSGHVHGGIVRLPFLGGLVSSDSGLFPKYNAGLYEKGKCKAVVSRGVGCSHIKFRFLNIPEVVSVVLKKTPRG